jgi:type I restriction enzyme S subunit
MSCSGTMGKVAIVPEGIKQGIINQALLKLTPTENISVEFLKYWMGSPGFQDELNRQSQGVAIKNVASVKVLKEIQIPLPPLPEQKRIVAILDEVFAGIDAAVANTKKNLANARELFESYLNAVFTRKGEGWVSGPIKQHIRFIDYRGKTPKKTESGLRLITAKNVKMGYLQEAPMEFVSPDCYDSWMTRGIPQQGDVLFTTEAPLANVAQFDVAGKVVFAQRIITMQPDRSKLDPVFLKYLLLSSPVQRRIREKGTGATVQGIKASLLKLIEIEFPASLLAQQQIVTKFDELLSETQRLETIYQQKLAALAELKQSILQKAFAGELTAKALEEVLA